MRTFLSVILLVPLSAVVLLLALANRAPVTLSLDPFSKEAPALAVSAPLFVVMFGGLFAGLLIGGAATWWTQGRHRRAARVQRREADRLRGEAETLRAGAAAGTPGVPAPLLSRRTG